MSRLLAFLLAAVMVVGSTFLVPAAAQGDERLTIPLAEYQDSGVSGSATLATTGDGIIVSMELRGAPLTGGHPTHIHTGTCDDFDPNPLYPLTTVILDEVSAEGVSETTVAAVSLADLLADDFVILVHQSPEELTNYLVCGDIKVSDSVMAAPQTGVGAMAAPARPALSVVLAVLAALSAIAGAGMLLRRRSCR